MTLSFLKKCILRLRETSQTFTFSIPLDAFVSRLIYRHSFQRKLVSVMAVPFLFSYLILFISISYKPQAV